MKTGQLLLWTNIIIDINVAQLVGDGRTDPGRTASDYWRTVWTDGHYCDWNDLLPVGSVARWLLLCITIGIDWLIIIVYYYVTDGPIIVVDNWNDNVWFIDY